MARLNSAIAIGVAASTLLLASGANAQSSADTTKDSQRVNTEIANDPLLKITVTGTRNEEKVHVVMGTQISKWSHFDPGQFRNFELRSQKWSLCA